MVEGEGKVSYDEMVEWYGRNRLVSSMGRKIRAKESIRIGR